MLDNYFPYFIDFQPSDILVQAGSMAVVEYPPKTYSLQLPRSVSFQLIAAIRILFFKESASFRCRCRSLLLDVYRELSWKQVTETI